MWGKPVMVKLILLPSGRMRRSMFRSRKRYALRKQKSVNITVCLKYTTIILNMSSQQTNLPEGNYEGIKTMHIADFLLSSEY